MKLQKTKNYKTKLLQLQLLKLYYKKESYELKTSLKRLELHLNKISNIIYRYHIANKKILFLGFPSKFKTLLKNTKHIVVPEHAWSNGMLSNRNQKGNSYNNTTLKDNRTSTRMFKLQKKIDLAVLYNLTSTNTAIKESYLARIPVITFTNKFPVNKTKGTYLTEGLHTFVNEQRLNNYFFFSITEVTLKRALKAKKFAKTKISIFDRMTRERKNFWE